VGVLVVSYNFLLKCSCRADPLVKKRRGKGKIIMTREGWKKKEKEKYHTTSKILSSLNSLIR
jgi:hypothetical protein